MVEEITIRTRKYRLPYRTLLYHHQKKSCTVIG